MRYYYGVADGKVRVVAVFFLVLLLLFAGPFIYLLGEGV